MTGPPPKRLSATSCDSIPTTLPARNNLGVLFRQQGRVWGGVSVRNRFLHRCRSRALRHSRHGAAHAKFLLDVMEPRDQYAGMGRPLRTPIGGLAYHTLNRANGRAPLFGQDADYADFLQTLADAQAEQPLRLLAYCVMPNHWHLVLWPERDGELSHFVGWPTLTHTQRWHASRGTAGSGHLYQGRFKSFVVESDGHLLTVCRYVERNALRAGLVARAEDWPWGSLWQRLRGGEEGRPALAPGPVPMPLEWLEWVNAPQTAAEEAAIRRCARRGQPFGSGAWAEQMIGRFGLHSTLRRPGRPRKRREDFQPLLFDENGS